MSGVLYCYAAVPLDPDPSPPSPSRREGEEFFAWLDRMHAHPPTVYAGEVYANGCDVVEVTGVDDGTVRWRSIAAGAREQRSYRVTFEEWAASEGTRRVPVDGGGR